ncbi:SulP family inorganic anion transporter [Staphylococcus xylosus]|uniref:SulP family inorganic anion transporter n=1 Tax=Staphylococcus xylosus TaxID=1288 RepID=UPI001C3EF278|nr:SulP family inorganic anion transporter [Staphylococcus xylosus]
MGVTFGVTSNGYIKQWQGNIIPNVLSGVLIAFALLPGAIAFSFIAGVSPTIGMLSTGLMMIVISFTGNRNLMVSAPSSGVSLVVAPLMASQGMQAVILATIIMGLIQIIFGYCHTNKLLDYIPTGVVIGFMNALGVLLFTSQLDNIFQISNATYVLVLISFLIIWLSQRYIKFIPAPLVSIIVLTFATWLIKPDILYVHNLASIHVRFPNITLPKMMYDLENIFIIFMYGLTMAIVAVVQTTLTARMMDVVTDTTSNKNKESIGQGIANFIVGLFGGYGGSALVGQSKFNLSMGATSRISTLITGSFLIFSLFVFASFIGQIPMAVLATVLITISLNTFDRRTVSFVKKAPIFNGGIVILTMAIILITNNLAAGVVIVTIGYYLILRLKNKKGRDI